MREELDDGGLGDASIVGFSYSGHYADPTTCESLTLAQAIKEKGVPTYEPSDTCRGIAAASARLSELVHTALAADPSLRLTIVAHSMGGVVASYFAATGDPEDLESVRAIVLLDSPVSGVPAVNGFTSACPPTSPSWTDMVWPSPALQLIQADACRRFPRFFAVAITPIGSTVPCAPLRFAHGITSGIGGEAAGGLLGIQAAGICGLPCGIIGWIVGSSAGRFVLDQMPAHAAVWRDATALSVIGAALHDSPRALRCQSGTYTVPSGQFRDVAVPVQASETLVASAITAQTGLLGSVGITLKVIDPTGAERTAGPVDSPTVWWSTVATRAGTYTVRLDNRAALLTGKTVFLQACSGSGLP